MQDMILNGIGDFVQRNLHNAGYLLVAVAALGWVLGSLKGVIASLFNAGLRLGDRAAAQAARKPKGAIVGISLVGLCFGGLWAWHEWSAPKIVEREVIVEKPIAVPVVDHENAAEAESARRDAEARAINAEAQARVAQQELEAKRQEAEELAGRLKAVLPPEGDVAAMQRLSKQVDYDHAEDVFMESTSPRFDHRKYRSYCHKRTVYNGTRLDNAPLVYYHRKCEVCDQSFKALVQIDEILERQVRGKKEKGAREWAESHRPLKSSEPSIEEQHRRAFAEQRKKDELGIRAYLVTLSPEERKESIEWLNSNKGWNFKVEEFEQNGK